MTSFTDETPVYVHLETDVGALAALVDDPILLTEHAPGSYYVEAKLRGIRSLVAARDSDDKAYWPLVTTATLLDCDRCHSGPGEPCWTDAGDAEVPIHQERKDEAARLMKEIEAHYAARGEMLDGES